MKLLAAVVALVTSSAYADICAKCSGAGRYFRGIEWVRCDRCGGDGHTDQPLGDQVGVDQGAGYQTNKFDLEAQVERGSWVVAWSDDIAESDALQGVVAAGVSIYSANPAPFTAWVDQLVDRTINSLGVSARERFPAEAKRQAERLAREAMSAAIRGQNANEVFRQFDTIDFKAGAIRYSGRNYAGNVTISRTWGMKLYVAFRVRGSGGHEGNGSRPASGTIIVSFRNSTRYRVNFHLNGGRGLESSIDPGRTVTYTMVVDPGVSPAVGINQLDGTRRSFAVSDGGRYEFKMRGREIHNYFRE
jgi:hypothetical protein